MPKRRRKKSNPKAWRNTVLLGGVVGGLYGFTQGDNGMQVVTTPVGFVIGGLLGEIFGGFLFATAEERGKAWVPELGK
jgi:hypothetical protein